jgi:hypothetical protein
MPVFVFLPFAPGPDALRRLPEIAQSVIFTFDANQGQGFDGTVFFGEHGRC